jgi:precorrin-6B methylase 1
VKRGSLTAVGIGVSVGSHATLQATREIERADVVLTLVPDRVAEHWIRSLNERAESLGASYVPGRNRSELYEEMAEAMLEHVRGGKRVCGVAFGHPGIVATPFHRAVERAREEGFEATMFPAVSSLDCLFADLGVDPARDGCSVYDATEFLARPRNVDPTSALVLFQLGVIGDPTVPSASTAPSAGLRRLSATLSAVYGRSHRVAAYVAAQHVIQQPRIDWIELERLASATIDRSATLYVPPLRALEIERM